MKAIFFGVAAMFMAGAAVAQDFEAPRWTTAPDGELSTALFPPFALFLGVEGQALVNCWVTQDGHPFLCRVKEEAPLGLGFGSAARLVVASGQIRTARRDGTPAATSFETMVRFYQQDDFFTKWTGAEPTSERMALAGKLAMQMREMLPPSYREMMLEGLDVDRHEVVRAWMDELMPVDEVRDAAILQTQIARLFSEDDLKRILAGEKVEMPSQDEFMAACPEPTPQERAAIDELKRRYCERYGCDV